MFVPKLIFCASVLSISQITMARITERRRCFDCVSIYSCESGLDFVRKLRAGKLSPENRQLTYNAVCGHERDQITPKVCCSDFPMNEQPLIPPTPPPTPPPTLPPTLPPTSTQTIVSVRSGNVDPEDHSNIRLLPAFPENVKITEEIDPVENHRNIGLLPTACGSIEGSRIINGEEAKLYEFPWMTLISYKTPDGLDFKCAGSVINSRYILTAAHCVIKDGRLKNIAGVRVGEHDLSTKEDCQGYIFDDQICESKIQDLIVEEIIPHERFTGRQEGQVVEADIALLRVKKEIIMENNVSPVCLPVYSKLRNLNLAGKNGTVAGWGRTENASYSTKLMKVVIPIRTVDVCSQYYNRYDQQTSITDTAFCAGKKQKDSCTGDSGGPLMMESVYNDKIRQVEYGIVSYGPEQCGSGIPGVYTDVTKYMKWILDNMRE